MFEIFKQWQQISKNSINSKPTRSVTQPKIRLSPNIGTLWTKIMVKFNITQMGQIGNLKQQWNTLPICLCLNMEVVSHFSKTRVLKTKTSTTIQIHLIWTTSISPLYQFYKSLRRRRNTSVELLCPGFTWEWCFPLSVGMSKIFGLIRSIIVTKAVSKHGMSSQAKTKKSLMISWKTKQGEMIYWIESPSWSIHFR